MTFGSVPPTAGTFTTRDGATIAFTRRPAPRPGSARLVLIHSMALDQTVWDDVAGRLTADAELLTYDCRGHGRSTRLAGPFTAELFADDLAALLDHIGWASAAVAGCSMGGCVALALAERAPSRVERLGLIDTTAWYGEGASARFAERAAAARAHGMAGLIDFQLTRWFSDAYRARRPAGLERAINVFLGNDVECYAATTAMLGAVDVRLHLSQIQVPVAVIVGEEDYATPVAMSRALHAAIPGATLTVLSQARHLTPIEHPDRISTELTALLARR